MGVLWGILGIFLIALWIWGIFHLIFDRWDNNTNQGNPPDDNNDDLGAWWNVGNGG